jgi:hypothetical protein
MSPHFSRFLFSRQSVLRYQGFCRRQTNTGGAVRQMRRLSKSYRRAALCLCGPLQRALRSAGFPAGQMACGAGDTVAGGRSPFRGKRGRRRMRKTNATSQWPSQTISQRGLASWLAELVFQGIGAAYSGHVSNLRADVKSSCLSWHEPPQTEPAAPPRDAEANAGHHGAGPSDRHPGTPAGGRARRIPLKPLPSNGRLSHGGPASRAHLAACKQMSTNMG